jgi:hypothetical protein
MTPYALSAKSDSIPGDKTQARLHHWQQNAKDLISGCG